MYVLLDTVFVSFYKWTSAYWLLTPPQVSEEHLLQENKSPAEGQVVELSETGAPIEVRIPESKVNLKEVLSDDS